MLKRTILSCYNVFIFYVMLTPLEPIESIPVLGVRAIEMASVGEGAVAHSTMMLLLFMLWYIDTHDKKISLLFTFLTGIILECLQLLLPWRFFILQDIIWNVIGMLSGFALTFLDRYFKGYAQPRWIR